MKNLEMLADSHLSGIIALYQNEHRDWWKNVNDNEIYDYLRDPNFAVEVDRIIQDAIGASYRIAG